VGWCFWIFGWGCGYESWWAPRGGDGEGGGALGSSHSARDRCFNSAHTHCTPAIGSSQVNGYIPARDAMRICLRYQVSRGDQCASGALLESFGRQVLAALREVG
jgi:hypothetical protein